MFRRLSVLSLLLIAAGIFGVSNAAAQYFTVPPGPSITIDANPLAVKAGDKTVVSWQAKPNPNTHSALIGCKGPGSGALWTWAAENLPWGFSSGDISGSRSFSVNGDTQYAVVCKDQSGTVSSNSIEVHTVLPLNCVSNSECNGQRVSVTAKLDIPNQTPSHEVSTAWSEGNYLKPPVTVSVNFYDTRPLWQKLEFWVPTIQQCADWSQGLVLWGSNFQTTLIQALPGTHRYPVSCYFTFGNQVISDEAVVNVVSSSTSTPTSTAAYQLTLEARDLNSGAPLKVPVYTSIKNGETTLVVGSDKAYNGNLSISVQTPIRIGASAYKFNHWAFSDSPATILSNVASISLNSDFPKRTAVAYYSLTSATTTTSTLQTYYYCSNNACVSGRYASAADCKNANGISCYNTAGECTAACPSSLPPGGKVQPKSGNININISSSQACLPQGGVNNSTNISWNISGPSCPAGFSLTQGSNQLSCSSNIPNGPTGVGQGSSNTSITQTTNFNVFCSYNTFTCEKTYQCDQTQKVITNPDGTTSTITVWQTCTDEAVVNGGSSSNSTTVYYVQPPRIDGFAASPQSILLNKPTSLGWSFQAPNSGTPTGQYCYPNGGSGDLSGWALGTKYNLSPEKIDNLSPQQNTAYNLICRNEATVYANCYNESEASTSVNVYKPSLQETNPAGLIESAFGSFFGKLKL